MKPSVFSLLVSALAGTVAAKPVEAAAIAGADLEPASPMTQHAPKAVLTVLVTGFGNFAQLKNPSWEIAKGLPSCLPALGADKGKTIEIPPVRILVPQEAIPVSYKAVREIVPSFWETYQGHKVDLAIHIGMTAGSVYKIERRGHRNGYKIGDIDEEIPEDEEKGKKGENWIWQGLPDEIQTELDLDDVLKRWQGFGAKNASLQVSEDAGRFLCDFIYYSSLSTLWKRQRPRKVVFLHVPTDSSSQAVRQGQELTLSLIRSMVESETQRAGNAACT
ncbi:pyroglutamyl peptidase domain-containing protein [Hirsutella rhossiliensis]|uniref:Pyroglutamyl peptidase domain-containing protein n=1 Tax=Hirsutella rhossiliensis TaxID=111463 RepID=A0A9P8SFG7_9HYPO|nr:pyroglutamyl peptidase domain-containing protein [Hirsutella rhossiliensis]KAH0959420.1 pyroglutamyl peptidase domain-containing protein [Hirsutella rhossiliensis]